MTVEELIEKAQQGNEQAFEQLVILYLRDIRIFTAMHFPDSHKVDEISQEVFIFAYQKLDIFDKGSFKAWLRAIAFNMIRKEKLRLQRKEKNLLNLREFLILQYAVNKKDPQLGNLELCLEQLQPLQRELIRLRYREKLTSEQIAEVSGRSAAWARMTLYRLRAVLKKCLSNDGSMLT